MTLEVKSLFVLKIIADKPKVCQCHAKPQPVVAELVLLVPVVTELVQLLQATGINWTSSATTAYR